MSEDAATATLLGPGIWTRQGPATLVVRENAWMVLVPGLRKQVTEAAWEVLGRRPAPEDLVDQLVEAGELGSADKLTALLFGVHDGESATLGVKGTTPLAVYSAEGARQIVGTEEEPMVLAPVEKVRRVAFGDLPPEEPMGAPRVVSGIVPVRGFVHMCVDPDQLEEEERKALVEQVEKDGRSIETEEAKKRRAERPAPKPAAKPAATPSRSSSSSSSTRTSTSSARRPGQTSTSSRQAPPEEPAGPNLFAGLFGDAPAAPSIPAGAAPSAADGAAPAPGTPAVEAPASQTPAPAASAESAPAAPSATAAPSASAEPAEPAGPVAPSASAEPTALAEPTASAEPSASAEPTAPADSAAPAAAADPSQSATPAASSSGPAPTGSAPQRSAAVKRRLVSTSLFDRKRAAAPAPASQAAPAPSAPSAPSEPAEQPTPSAAPTPSASSAPPAPRMSPAPDTSSAPSATSSPVAISGSSASPARPAAPAPAASAAPSAASAPSAPSASLPTRAESPAAPTPTPADEGDALQSPPTLVAPIDDGDFSEHDDPSAPAAPAGLAGHPGPAAQPAPETPAASSATPALPEAVRHAPAAPSGDLENSGAYDDLFGKTVFRRIEDAAVRRSGEDDEDEHAESAAPAPGAGASGAAVEDEVPEETRIPGAASADEVEETPVAEHTTGDFIDWVPGVGRTAPEIAQAAARRAARPQTAPPAYPQVHMAERPPAPVTGSRPAPSRAGDRRGDAGGDPRAGGSPHGPRTPHSGQTPYGSGSPYGAGSPHGAPSAQGAGSPHGAPSPYGRPGPDPRAAGPAPQGRHASAPHPVAPQHGAVPPSTPRPGTPQPSTPRPGASQPAPQQAASPQHGQHAAGSPLPAVRPSGGAVALPGLVCRNGHANPPDGTSCRICAEPLAGPTRTVARPPLGAIAVSTGERYVLDRSTIVGRRPRASRVSVHDVPQLVTVPSPQQDISRSHLELRLEGWHVVALDLATTNGTTLHRPGHEPLRLRAREGVLLRDGDLLDLGDDVHLTYGEKA